MNINVNGILAGLKQGLAIASVLLATAVLLKLFGFAPRGLPGTVYDLSAATVAAAFASK